MEAPTHAELTRIFHNKYGRPEELYWGPRLRWKFGYFNPDDCYETVVDKLVKNETRWLDVGSGRDVFPSNCDLAKELSKRCRLLVGADPDPTICENPFVHEKQQVTIEDFRYQSKFDLITMRMVAEHVVDPASAVAAIAEQMDSGGRVVIYTVNKFSPVPLITRLIPFGARHRIKKILWGTEEKDTFPTAFRLNSRRTIRKYMSQHGMQEDLFMRLDDCRSFARWRVTLFLELLLQRVLRTFRIPYPENCILVVYRKT